MTLQPRKLVSTKRISSYEPPPKCFPINDGTTEGNQWQLLSIGFHGRLPLLKVRNLQSISAIKSLWNWAVDIAEDQ